MEEKKIWWRKIGSGVWVFNNEYIKPGQKILAYPSEIPESIRDIVVPCDTIPDIPSIPDPPAEFKYELKRAKGGLFNVVDSTGKVINENPMKKADAENLIKSL